MPTGSEKLRVVIDTNVFVSGLNFSGRPSEVLELLWQEEIEVYISPFILQELERVLRERFGWSQERPQTALKIVREKAIEVNPAVEVSIIKDKATDNRILECALAAQAPNT